MLLEGSDHLLDEQRKRSHTSHFEYWDQRPQRHRRNTFSDRLLCIVPRSHSCSKSRPKVRKKVDSVIFELSLVKVPAEGVGSQGVTSLCWMETPVPGDL